MGTAVIVQRRNGIRPVKDPSGGTVRSLAGRLVAGLVVAVVAMAGLPASSQAAVTPSISVSGPASAVSGDTVTLTGRLTADAPGGVTVSIWEARAADDPTVTAWRPLPTVATAGDGTFTVTATPPGAGHYTYTVATTVTPTGGTATAVRATTTLTVSGPQVYLAGPTVQAYLQHPFTVTVALRSWVGPPVADATLHVERRGGGGPVQTLPDVVTGADGTASVTATPDALGSIVYRFTWDGDATHPLISGVVGVGVSRVPTTIAVSVAGPVKVHDPVVVSGSVSFGAGDQVTAPQALSVARGRLSGPWTPLTAVTTAADGTFTFQDTSAAPGTWYYRVTRTADQLHAFGLATSGPALVKPRDTTLTLTVPDGQTIAWGKPFTVTGRLTLEAPGTPVPANLQVGTNGTCNQEEGAWNLRLAADGTFTATTLPSCLHDVVVSAWYADPDHAGVRVTTTSRPVGRAPGRTSVSFGGSIGPPNTTDWLAPTGVQPLVDRGVGTGRMDVYAQPAGRARTLVARLTLKDGYTTGFTYAPEVTTTFTFVWSGDSGTSASTTRATLLVRPYLRQDLQLNQRVSGGWLVYSTRTDPWYVATATPGPRGRPLTYVIEQYVSGKWRPVVSRTVGLDKNGWVQLYLRGKHVKGTRFRIHTIWRGDATNAPTTTDWISYRFA